MLGQPNASVKARPMMAMINDLLAELRNLRRDGQQQTRSDAIEGPCDFGPRLVRDRSRPECNFGTRPGPFAARPLFVGQN